MKKIPVSMSPADVTHTHTKKDDGKKDRCKLILFHGNKIILSTK